MLRPIDCGCVTDQYSASCTDRLHTRSSICYLAATDRLWGVTDQYSACCTDRLHTRSSIGALASPIVSGPPPLDRSRFTDLRACCDRSILCGGVTDQRAAPIGCTHAHRSVTLLRPIDCGASPISTARAAPIGRTHAHRSVTLLRSIDCGASSMSSARAARTGRTDRYLLRLAR